MKTKFNNILMGIALAIVMAVSISSCKKDNDNSDPSYGQLSFVNAVEGSAAQSVYVNDGQVNINAIAYGNSASNINIPAGNKNVAFKNTGTATVSASANVNVDANSSKTLFLIKQSDNSLVITAYNNETTTTSDKARVRFINVAPLLSATVNVTTTTGTSIISALCFKAASAYQTVNAATALNVTMTGSLEVTAIAASEFQAGKIYTVWFDSSTTTKAKYHVVVEN